MHTEAELDALLAENRRLRAEFRRLEEQSRVANAPGSSGLSPEAREDRNTTYFLALLDKKELSVSERDWLRQVIVAKLKDGIGYS
jgi:hypothetical protein